MFFFVVAVPGFAPRVAALRRTKPALAAAMGKFLRGSQTYLLMTALFGAIVGVLDAGALWLLGVPLPLVWGFFSFLTNFIPNIGFIIGIIPPAFLALLDDGWQGMLPVILAYSVLNVTIQTFIQPRIVGNSVGLSAEITFMSLVVWTFLLGALGALLAVPMTLLVRAIFIDSDSRACVGGPADRREGRGTDHHLRLSIPFPDTRWVRSLPSAYGRGMRRQRCDRHGHVREERQVPQQLVQLLVVGDVEDAEVRVGTDHAPEVHPLSDSLELLAVGLLAGQELFPTGQVEREVHVHANGDEHQAGSRTKS